MKNDKKGIASTLVLIVVYIALCFVLDWLGVWEIMFPEFYKFYFG